MNNLTIKNILFSLLLSVFASSVLAQEHVMLEKTHAKAGVKCTDCHETKPFKAVPMVKCLACHNTADLADSTKDVKPTNPHKNRHFGTETDCNYCHKQHKESENYCAGCHPRFDFVVP